MDNTNEQPPFWLLGGVLNLFTRTNAHLQHFKKHFFLKRARKIYMHKSSFDNTLVDNTLSVRNRVRWRHLKKKFELTLLYTCKPIDICRYFLGLGRLGPLRPLL